jgi:tetratricopeptide (TPR) repeat protein
MYAPAWEGLSTVYTYQVDVGVLPFEEGYSKARDAAKRALEIDPGYAQAHAHLGWDAMIFGGDYGSAAEHFRIARRLAPNNPAALGNSATLLAVIGRPDDAIDLVRRVISLDPIDSVIYTNLGAFQMAANRLEEADASISKALELSPGDIWAQQAMVYLRILQGRPEDALTLHEHMDTSSSGLAMLPMIYHGLRRQAEADDALAGFERLHAEDSALKIAENYAWQGKIDDAFAWLQRAFDEDQSIQFIRTSAFFSSLKTDPRWEETLSKLGLADDQVSDIEL